MSKVYVKYGSESSFRGLRVEELEDYQVDDFQNCEIISEEEYNSYLNRINNRDGYFTSTGALLNKEGKRLYDEIISIQDEIRNEEYNKELSFFITKFKKEIELGIFDTNNIRLAIRCVKGADKFEKEILSEFGIVESENIRNTKSSGGARERYKNFVMNNT